MEKVKVTREQAEAIEWALKYSNVYADKPNELLQRHGYAKYNDDGFSQKLTPLNDLETIDLAKVLLGNYEVEPEFKINDWITHKVDGTVGKVTKTEPCLRTDKGMGGYLDGFRLSTPEEIKQEKERRWWKKHGRGVWELRKGDVLRSKSTHLTYEIVDITDNGITFTNDAGFRDKDLIKGCYKVLCFAENRLDVNTNERSGTVGRYKEYARKRRRHTSI